MDRRIYTHEDPSAEPGYHLYQAITWAAKGLMALVICAVLAPPLVGAVAVATLVRGPVPVGDLPDERPQAVAVPSLVYAADGRQIGLFRGFDQTVEVTPEEIPEILKQAVVAIEDKRFYQHDGVDIEGIVRAARTNIEVGGIAQGGSTLTQQYVKNVYLSTEQTIERKVEEALLATELEKQMTKDEILFGYLTTSYYGSGAYGIGAAAEIYFDKSVSDLDISEAATLAGVVQAPTRLSPFENRAAADQRRRLVLQAMLDEDYITPDDYDRQVVRRLWSVEDSGLPDGPVTTLIPREKKGAMAYPHFVDMVEAELVERLGPDLVYRGGLTITTTIDPDRQRAAEAAVAARLENTEYPIEMALASVDPSTGHIVAMVGGRDYDFSQVNLATGGSTGFQPGSSFKPLVMATAFALGLGPDTTYSAPGQWTVPGCSGTQCTVSNYDYKNYGRLTLRDAMRWSVNTVFTQLVLDVGVTNTVELASDLGLYRLDPDRSYGASLALGSAESSPLEMAAAYSVFANRGVKAAITPILRVVDADGNVLIDNSAPTGTRVLDTAVADNVTDVLVDVVEAGTGTRAQIGRPVAGKTGTAQAYRAAWFVGYTPQLSTAVWMGYADRQESLIGVNGVARVTGGSHPALAFSEFMAAAHTDLEVVEFPEVVEIVPMADDDREMLAFRSREETLAGPRRPVEALEPNCSGVSCERSEAHGADLPEPEQPDYEAMATSTTAPPTPPTTPLSTPPATTRPPTPSPTTTVPANDGSSSTTTTQDQP